jgi:glucose-6-phosphate isomerase
MDVTNLSQFTELVLTRNIFSLFSGHQRSENYTISAVGLFLDYAKQNIVDSEFTPLFTLAEQVDLAGKISAQFSGEKINTTEQRSVLHTVLRAPDSVKLDVLGVQANEVISTEAKMAAIVDDVHSGKVCSVTGEKFTDILAIRIGGFYYGVKVA